jgi:hypothetical protein
LTYDKIIKDENKTKTLGEDVYITQESTEYRYFDYSDNEETSKNDNKEAIGKIEFDYSDLTNKESDINFEVIPFD